MQNLNSLRKTRILLFIHSLSYGGAERVSSTLLNYWEKQGHYVVLVTIADPSRNFYRLEPGIKRIALCQETSSHGAVEAILNNIRRIWALYRVLRAEKPTVAIAMMTTENVAVAIAGRLARVPTIGSERNYPPRIKIRRVWVSIRRHVYPYLSGIVAQTNESAGWLSANAPAPRITVIPNPITYPLTDQSSPIPPRSFISQLTGKKVLLAVGRLVHQKGYDILLAAFSHIAPKYPDWSLIVLGEGELRNKLDSLVIELGLQNRVLLPGVAGNVGEWYEAADAFVMTSRFEGFPNTLLEALSYGLPSLAVDCNTGPRDIIEPEVNGLLVPQDDQQALIAGLDRLLGDDALRQRLAINAIDSRDRYAVHRIAQRWEEFIAEVVSGQ